MHSYPYVVRNVIHVKTPCPLHWRIPIQNTCKLHLLQLLLYKIGFVNQKLPCIFPSTFRTQIMVLNLAPVVRTKQWLNGTVQLRSGLGGVGAGVERGRGRGWEWGGEGQGFCKAWLTHELWQGKGHGSAWSAWPAFSVPPPPPWTIALGSTKEADRANAQKFRKFLFAYNK